jgi:hypothetical protein
LKEIRGCTYQGIVLDLTVPDSRRIVRGWPLLWWLTLLAERHPYLLLLITMSGFGFKDAVPWFAKIESETKRCKGIAAIALSDLYALVPASGERSKRSQAIFRRDSSEVVLVRRCVYCNGKKRLADSCHVCKKKKNRQGLRRSVSSSECTNPLGGSSFEEVV